MTDQPNTPAPPRAMSAAIDTQGAGRPWFARQHRRLLPLALCALAGLALTLLALFSAPAPAAARPGQQIPTDPPSARNGQALYVENCAPCHGAAGLGDGPTAVDLPDVAALVLADPERARQATPADWFEVIKEGRMVQMMPPWKNRLSDAQIWDVTAYALALHSDDAALAQGEKVWGQQCAACHGAGGAGDGPQAVADGLTMPDLTDPALAASRSLADWHALTAAGQGAMPPFADVLSDEEIWAAATYARSFSFQPAMAAAAPAGAGQLSGHLLNGTTGQPVQALVTLNVFENFQPMQPQQVESGADGAFRFEALPTGAQYAFMLSTLYGDASFGSNIVRFTEGQTALDVPLQVYDASATPGEITVNLAQWFIDSHQGALLVGELYRIDHQSDTVYTGSEEIAPGKNAVLRLNLPAGATSVTLDGGQIGERFVRTAEGVVDTQPLPPGGTQLLLRYLLPTEGDQAELAHSVPYPVQRLNVLVIDGLEVSTPLQSLGAQTVADEQWNSFEGIDLPADAAISLRLGGLTEAGAPPPAAVDAPGAAAVVAHNPRLLFGVGVASFLALLAVLAAYLWLKPRPEEDAAQLAPAAASAGGLSRLPYRNPPAAASAGGLSRLPYRNPPAGAADPAAERQRLLAAIAQLDDLYAAGELDAEDYQRARLVQKRSLVLASQQMADGARSETGPSGDGDGEGARAGL